MCFRSLLTTLALFVLAGCAQPTNTDTTIIAVEGISPGRELGVTVDESLKVVDLDPQGAASAADVRVGDILIDLTLVEMREPTSHPIDSVPENPRPTPTATVEGPPLPPEAFIVADDVVVPTTVPQPLPTSSDSVSHETDLPSEEIVVMPEEEIVITPGVVGDKVPFTDREQAKRLVSLNATLKLRLNRDGNILEIVLQTTPRAPRPDSPTPTPVIFPYDYY